MWHMHHLCLPSVTVEEKGIKDCLEEIQATTFFYLHTKVFNSTKIISMPVTVTSGTGVVNLQSEVDFL